MSTCPFRVLNPGPCEQPRRGVALNTSPGGISSEGLDEFVTDFWTADHDEAQRARDAWAVKFPPPSSQSPTAGEWLWDWGPPRVCGFCGSVHPEDAIRLKREGWEIEVCDGGGKCYLNPPGTSDKRRIALAAFREVGAGDVNLGVIPSVWSPVPPVKVRGAHFTPEQLVEFNDKGGV